jgi:hypothetical protein
MVTDFTMAWQFSQREHFFVTDQTPHPIQRKFFKTGFRAKGKNKVLGPVALAPSFDGRLHKIDS